MYSFVIAKNQGSSLSPPPPFKSCHRGERSHVVSQCDRPCNQTLMHCCPCTEDNLQYTLFAHVRAMQSPSK